jgi:hypothetical protein
VRTGPSRGARAGPADRMHSVYAALVHHPVVDRHGRVIASAVTNLDVHDLARLARTYGLGGVYLVTPLGDQQEFARRIVDHWTTGPGADCIPDRRAAMQLVEVVGTIADAIAAVAAREGRCPHVTASGAREHPGALRHAEWRDLRQAAPQLLLFGTAWGLAPEVFAAADHVLHPIAGACGYNHLSVRCAAAILIDRLLGDRTY